MFPCASAGVPFRLAAIVASLWQTLRSPWGVYFSDSEVATPCCRCHRKVPGSAGPDVRRPRRCILVHAWRAVRMLQGVSSGGRSCWGLQRPWEPEEPRAHNGLVGGSSPSGPTISRFKFHVNPPLPDPFLARVWRAPAALMSRGS